jgi:hypothetical protein
MSTLRDEADMNQKPHNNTPAETGTALHAALISGLGGILPTLSSIAGAVAANPADVDFITLGHVAAMALYYLLAFILCLGLQERRLRESFIMGIAAPAIVINLISGASSTSGTSQSTDVVFYLNPISSAYAAPTEKKALPSSSTFLTDFKRGLGFNVELEDTKKQLEDKIEIIADQKTLLENISSPELLSLKPKIVTLISDECEPTTNVNVDDTPTSLPHTPNEGQTNQLPVQHNQDFFSDRLNDDEYFNALFGDALRQNSSILGDIINLQQLEHELKINGFDQFASQLFTLKEMLVLDLPLSGLSSEFIKNAFLADLTLLNAMDIAPDPSIFTNILIEQSQLMQNTTLDSPTSSIDIVMLIRSRTVFSRALYTFRISPSGQRYSGVQIRLSRRERLKSLFHLYKDKYRYHLK